MNILYCGDAGIFKGVVVSILSILKYNKQPINFYVMTIDGKKAKSLLKEKKMAGVSPGAIENTIKTRAFKKESAELLDELVKKTNPKSFVRLIDATEEFVSELPEKNMGSYFTPCSMLRLYADKMPELKKCKRILYLDYDVVARGNLEQFYDTDLSGIEAAGVLDIYGRRFYKYRGIFKREDAGVVDAREKKDFSFLKQDYMNSGVMLFNMEECRKTGMFKKAREICRKRKMMLADQAALNKAISKRKLMERKYNEQNERPFKDTVLHHFSNNFKFWPYFKVQKVKPFEVEKIHDILKIHEYDDILEEYQNIIK